MFCFTFGLHIFNEKHTFYYLQNEIQHDRISQELTISYCKNKSTSSKQKLTLQNSHMRLTFQKRSHSFFFHSFTEARQRIRLFLGDVGTVRCCARQVAAYSPSLSR